MRRIQVMCLISQSLCACLLRCVHKFIYEAYFTDRCHKAPYKTKSKINTKSVIIAHKNLYFTKNKRVITIIIINVVPQSERLSSTWSLVTHAEQLTDSELVNEDSEQLG